MSLNDRPSIPEGYVDGCTGFWDTIVDHDISHCCNAHDEAYWYSQSIIEKFVADFELFLCVASFGDVISIVVGVCMLIGTATVGTYFYLNRDRFLDKNKG